MNEFDFLSFILGSTFGLMVAYYIDVLAEWRRKR